jgi:hypothetical protein
MAYSTPQTEGSRPPRPSNCPTCGLTADNGIPVRSELTTTATYCDTAGHLWAVTWMEVA